MQEKLSPEIPKSKWEQLREPIDFKWRVQSSGKYSTTLVAYIDARDVEDVLDKIIGPENWQNSYTTIANQTLCNIGIRDPSAPITKESWIWKQDGGTESNIEKEKGLLSDCFKRAAVKWGIGRFLYRKKPYKLPSMPKVKADGTPYKDKFGKDMYVPAHDPEKYGPVSNIPFGIVYKLEIRDVDRYIWEFLKPFLENKNKSK